MPWIVKEVDRRQPAFAAQIRNPKSEVRIALLGCFWIFFLVFWVSLGFRISDFGFFSRQDIDIADTYQPTVEVVAPLLDRERVMNKRIGVTGGVVRPVVRPALVVGLEGVIAIVQVQLGPADS